MAMWQFSMSERMAEGDQLVGALGAHDSGDDGGIEYRPLGRAQTAVAQRRGDGRGKAHPRLGDRGALAGGLWRSTSTMVGRLLRIQM